ncbi:hypothetical protein B0H13DRAFT_1902340 [Mycena leptocephala]|nr:hypothetical protein B0H13DRAFT_1902340 [Mycena leptocephala]
MARWSTLITFTGLALSQYVSAAAIGPESISAPPTPRGIPSYAPPQDPRPSASYAPPQAPRPSASYGPPAAREIHGSVGVPPILPKLRPTYSSGPLHPPAPDIFPICSHPIDPVDVRATEAQEGDPNELKGTILPRPTRPSQPQPQPTTTGHDFSG